MHSYHNWTRFSYTDFFSKLQVCPLHKVGVEPPLVLLQEDPRDLVQAHHLHRVSHPQEGGLQHQRRQDLLRVEGVYLLLQPPEDLPQVGVKPHQQGLQDRQPQHPKCRN